MTYRPDGTRRLYQLDEAGAAEIRRYMERLWGDVQTRFTIIVENTSPGEPQK